MKHRILLGALIGFMPLFVAAQQGDAGDHARTQHMMDEFGTYRFSSSEGGVVIERTNNSGQRSESFIGGTKVRDLTKEYREKYQTRQITQEQYDRQIDQINREHMQQMNYSPGNR